MTPVNCKQCFKAQCQVVMEGESTALNSSERWRHWWRHWAWSSPLWHSSCTEEPEGDSLGRWGRQAGEGPHHPHQHSLPTLCFAGVSWGCVACVTCVKACLSLLAVEFRCLRLYNVHSQRLHTPRDGHIGSQLLQGPTIHLSEHRNIKFFVLTRASAQQFCCICANQFTLLTNNPAFLYFDEHIASWPITCCVMTPMAVSTGSKMTWASRKWALCGGSGTLPKSLMGGCSCRSLSPSLSRGSSSPRCGDILSEVNVFFERWRIYQTCTYLHVICIKSMHVMSERTERMYGNVLSPLWERRKGW